LRAADGGVTIPSSGAPTRPCSKESAVPEPPQAGPYRIEGELGRGGMGVVLLGHDPAFGRPLAVKVLHERHRDDWSFVDSFTAAGKQP
jgi:serine/threonine protein kinase